MKIRFALVFLPMSVLIALEVKNMANNHLLSHLKNSFAENSIKEADNK